MTGTAVVDVGVERISRQMSYRLVVSTALCFVQLEDDLVDLTVAVFVNPRRHSPRRPKGGPLTTSRHNRLEPELKLSSSPSSLQGWSIPQSCAMSVAAPIRRARVGQRVVVFAVRAHGSGIDAVAIAVVGTTS